VRRLVTIDLTGADLEMFDAHEAEVLALLPKHSGRLEMRVRTLDGSSETHLLAFPDAQSFEGYLSDPQRVAALSRWEGCGARSTVVLVEQVQSAVPGRSEKR